MSLGLIPMSFDDIQSAAIALVLVKARRVFIFSPEIGPLPCIDS